MINKSLFDLIHSLSKSEKRYIKLEQLNGDAKHSKFYRTIFDSISESGDRKVMPDVLASLSKKKLNNAQNYLYHLTLTGLKNFNSESSVKIRLRNLLIEAEILFEKSLIDQAVNKMDRAEELAKKFMLDEDLFEIAAMKHNIFVHLNVLFHTNPEIKENRLIEAMNLQQRSIENLERTIAYRELATNYFADSIQFTSNKTATLHLQNLLKNPLLHVAEDRLPMEAWSSLMSLKTLAYFFAGKYKEGIKYAFEHIDVVEKQYPHLAANSPASWVNTIYNYLGYCYRLKKYDQLLIYLDKIREILNSSKRKGNRLAYARLWINYYQYRLVININTASLNELNNIVKELGIFMQKDADYIEDAYHVTLYYLQAYSYFMKADYKETSHWLNRILNETAFETRPDYQIHARILYFTLQVERRKTALYQHAVDQYIEYLESRSEPGIFEQILLQFMQTVLKTVETGLIPKKVFQELKKKLATLKKHPDLEKQVTYYFDYISWLRSQIEQKPFLETFKKQNRIKS